MVEGTIYLGFTCCPEAPKFPKARFSRGKWNPEKLVRCPNCDSPVELAELEWFEKQTIIHFREMGWIEASEFSV